MRASSKLDHVNIEILVENKWCSGYLQDMWCVPDSGRHLFPVLSMPEHGISVIIKCKRGMFQCSGQLVASGQWMMDANAMDIRVVVPRKPAEFNIVTASETLRLWHERLGHQEKRHVRKVPTSQVTSEQDGQ